jgi:hypothetical protein
MAQAGGYSRGASLTPGSWDCPPQAVENGKITGVSLWSQSDLFLAGNLAGKNRKHFGSFAAQREV